MFNPPDSTEFILSLLAFVVFLAIYYDAFYKKGRRAWFGIIAITLISLGMSYITASASIFFIYAVMIAVQSQRGKARLIWFLGILAVVVLPAIPGFVPGAYAAGCLLFGPLVAAGTVTTSLLEDQATELFETRTEMRNMAISAERERIARDMHDTLGHVLSTITAKSDLAARLVNTDPENARLEMEAVNQTGRDALKQIRNVIAGMENATITGELGHARYLLETVNIHVEIENTLPVLEASHEHAVGMMIREATTNVAKHANATRCRISLNSNDDSIVLSVEDNGHGTVSDHGRGLTSISNRTELLGGTLDLMSTKKLGTRLRVTLPNIHSFQP